MDPQDRCPNCFAATTGTPCPACGWQPGYDNAAPALPLGLVLNGCYHIGRVLGHGGFGITYLAWDENLSLAVAIKEFLPLTLASRGPDRTSLAVRAGEAREQFAYGLEQFLDEARKLARFEQHPGIVSVKAFFRAHGTAYMVMEYLDGLTLKAYLAQQPGGRIPFATARDILTHVMDALRACHREDPPLLHRDIAPDNIYLSRGGRIILIDFGAARQAMRDQSQALSIIFKPGYAPWEQCRSGGRQGPWTDVYGVAATCYRAITGQTPPEAPDRIDEDLLVPPARLGIAIPPAAEAALMQALAVRPGDRTQDIERLQRGLRGAVERAPPKPPARPAEGRRAPDRPPPRPAPPAPAAKGRGGLLLGLGLAVLVVGGLIGLAVWQQTPVTPTPTPLVVAPALPVTAPVVVAPAPRVAPPAPMRPVIPPPVVARQPYEPELVAIPAGCFDMGSPENQPERDSDETLHRVCVDAFRMGKYEVTFAQRDACVADGGCTHRPDDQGWGRGDRPVINVSWNDAQDYSQWLSRKTGQTWRLPSEAEWEYAARAGTRTAYWWGDEPGEGHANCNGCGSRWDNQQTAPVGSFPGNPWGLYDTAGNVWEWTCSAYGKYDGQREKRCASKNDAGARALRGGSWYYGPYWLPAAFRKRIPADYRFNFLGLRLAQDQ